MGKGGVGMTIVAAAVAVGPVKRGHKVHLTTTDPAADVSLVMDGSLDGLTVDASARPRLYEDHTCKVTDSTLSQRSFGTRPSRLCDLSTQHIPYLDFHAQRGSCSYGTRPTAKSVKDRTL